jgi:glycosyltransferase involved in cell wall biosynthesis
MSTQCNNNIERVFILVPVYEEGDVFRAWLPSLIAVAQELDAGIVVIDDGSGEKVQVPRGEGQKGKSGDEDDPSFAEATEDLGVRLRIKVLRHPVNCGVGAAIQTGLEYVKQFDPDVVLTIDGDGQHRAEDLMAVYAKLNESECDIVNGSRFLKKQSIPFMRKCANRFGNLVNFLLSGYWVSDSQSGMKGFGRSAVQDMRISSAGYEWCMDVFRESNRLSLKIQETPVSVLYNSYTLNKGQSFAIGIDMLFRLIIRSLVRSHS